MGNSSFIRYAKNPLISLYRVSVNVTGLRFFNMSVGLSPFGNKDMTPTLWDSVIDSRPFLLHLYSHTIFFIKVSTLIGNVLLICDYCFGSSFLYFKSWNKSFGTHVFFEWTEIGTSLFFFISYLVSEHRTLTFIFYNQELSFVVWSFLYIGSDWYEVMNGRIELDAIAISNLALCQPPLLKHVKFLFIPCNEWSIDVIESKLFN